MRSISGNPATYAIAVPSAGPSMPSQGVSASDSTRFSAAMPATTLAAAPARPAPTRKFGVTASIPHSSQ